MFIENRQILPPGYAGHIPFRNEVIGLTHGEATKLQLQQYEIYSGTPSGRMIENAYNFLLKSRGNSVSRGQVQAAQHSYLDTKDDPQYIYQNQKFLQIGNQSRNAASWVGGPRHEIRLQKIPGYQGFLPGINSENLYGKSFSKCSAASVNNKIERGNSISPEKRYMSQNHRAYAPKNFRRLKERPELANQRDYMEYAMTLNQQDRKSRTRILDLSADDVNLDTVNTTKSKNSRNYYYDPTEVTLSPHKTVNPSSNNFYMLRPDIQVKPILLEKKLAEQDEFKKLGEGFKRIFSQDTNDQESLVIPVVGYAGHRKGSVAENMYGKTFREAAIQSKKIERVASLCKSSFIKPN